MWQIVCMINQGVDVSTAITFNLRPIPLFDPETWVRVAMSQLGYGDDEYALEIQVTPEDCEPTR